jgi:hypothetical protein
MTTDLHTLSNDELRALIRNVRDNPPADWPATLIYDTPLSYEACLLLGRRITWSFGPKTGARSN